MRPKPSPFHAGATAPDDWVAAARFAADHAAEFAASATIEREVLGHYMAAYIVSDRTADQQVRQLTARILQTGRLTQSPSGHRLVAHAHSQDGAYAVLVNPPDKKIIGYDGPRESWFERSTRLPLEDLRRRASAHERSVGRDSALPVPSWPMFPPGQAYDWHGRPVAVPWERRPITDEDTVRRAGRTPTVVFQADALNSPFFQKVPLEDRPAAMRAVLDKLLRAPSKGTVHIAPDRITVTGGKVTLTLSRDCRMVRTLNPPTGNTPALYKAKRWRLPEK
ncbi:hypothetical protein [Streptomyces nanshensis]|nr:hypothetical protein [Streptomyces nanshensis]